MRTYSLKLFNALAIIACICACSGNDTAGGISEETEGIVALTNKKIAGAAQKGPLVKGSNVVIKETSANGTLEPTGREFNTTITGDKGDFAIDSINLESQYALLSAEGYYIHEHNGQRSECPMRLDAVSNLENRETSNINLLTHFEYKRVLNLVKAGKSFANGKKQAASEILGAFGVHIDISSAEDLNIFNTSEADRTLYNISLIIDERYLWDPWDGKGDEMEHWENKNVNCSKLQDYIDRIADDFADDGILSDSIMQHVATLAYETLHEHSEMENIDEKEMERIENEDPSLYESLSVKKKKYEFSKLLFSNYMGIEPCTENLWGNRRQFNKPIVTFGYYGDETILDSGYVICNGHYWELTTKEHIDSLTMRIEHQLGTMTDPRDGQQYKTVSFTYNGKNYEWMAEDLKYAIPNSQDSSAYGLYSWTTAMQIDASTTDTIQQFSREAYKSDEDYEQNKVITIKAPADAIDSLHQGICPTGWHIANTLDWEALLFYVEGVNNLLNENWNIDYSQQTRDLTGVFYNRFDFNLEPMDKTNPKAYYHTYTHESFSNNIEAEYNALRNTLEANGTIDEEWASILLAHYHSNRNVDNTSFEITFTFGIAKTKTQKTAKVRCIKN